MLCSLFGYTKQAYYKCSTRSYMGSIESQQAREAVLEIRKQMPRIGTRKLIFMLKAEFENNQIKMGRDRLFDLLRADGLLVIKRKRYTVTTDSNHWLHKHPNLIKEMDINKPEQVWVADITYIDTASEPGYLHLITDAYSKQIMGYELCNDMHATSTLKALKMAIKARIYKDREIIHHSDRGSQYCSKLYTNWLLKNNFKISMTENGDPYENAVAERANGILKDEFGLGEQIKDIQEAKMQASQSIAIYNTVRPHLSCRYLTPNEMHKQEIVPRKRWKKKIPQSPKKGIPI